MPNTLSIKCISSCLAEEDENSDRLQQQTTSTTNKINSLTSAYYQYHGWWKAKSLLTSMSLCRKENMRVTLAFLMVVATTNNNSNNNNRCSVKAMTTELCLKQKKIQTWQSNTTQLVWGYSRGCCVWCRRRSSCHRPEWEIEVPPPPCPTPLAGTYQSPSSLHPHGSPGRLVPISKESHFISTNIEGDSY